MLRARELNPDGNVPVNFHSAEGYPASQLLPPEERTKEEKYKRLLVVNRDSGQIAPMEPETMHFPAMKELKPGVEEQYEKEF